MKRRYPRGRDDRGLFPELRDVLLDGWGAPIPADHYGDADRAFEIFFADLAAAWKTHRATLMQEWKRRGCVGLPWAAKKFDRLGTNYESTH